MNLLVKGTGNNVTMDVNNIDRVRVCGPDTANGFIVELSFKDKHGLTRSAYNAKINIYRDKALPILLGIEDRKLSPDIMPAKSVV